ncbi:MAG: hypothetical protein WAN65_06140, partial [Candidatus Sulfotelmatobacter sp.]
IGQELDYEKIERVAIGSVSKPNSSFLKEMKEGEFNPVQRWRTSLTVAQLHRLETLLGSSLEQFGYAREDFGEKASLARKTLARVASSDSSLKRMRLLYERYFDTKLRLKKKAPFGKLLASHDLPRF